MTRRAGVLLLMLSLVLSTGCSSRNPSWADAINPCCGQDLVLRGIEPPEDRCADIVLDQETARRLMADVASGSGMTHWHVRFIPGGPACIWQEWPGLTEEEFREVELPAEQEDGREDARPDSVAAPAQGAPH